MLVITRIPTHRNDGAKISAVARRDVLRQVRDAFGGYTLEGPFQGAWVADVALGVCASATVEKGLGHGKAQREK